jgi:hypothetical protein
MDLTMVVCGELLLRNMPGEHHTVKVTLMHKEKAGRKTR